MSNAKRDWMKHDDYVIAAIAYKEGDIFLWDVAHVAESIVRRELAGEVEKVVDSALEKHRSEPHSIRHTMVAAFRALLSPHQNDAEVGE